MLKKWLTTLRTDRRKLAASILVVTAMIGLTIFGIIKFSRAEGGEYTTGLTSWWKLNESSGSSAADSSGNTHTGTLNGNTAFSTDVPNSSSSNTHSATFDGTGDYISVASPGLPTAGFTYTAWIKPTTTTSGTILEAADGAGGDEFKLSLTAASKLTVTMDNSAIFTSTTALSSATWYHVAVVRRGITVTLYLNGSSDGTGSKSTVLNFNGCALYMGTDVGSSCGSSLGTDYNGFIDDVRVYDRALDPMIFRQFSDLPAPGGVFGGLTMWLDAQDSSTLFTSNACTGAASTGNDIGCWKDKSGIGNNATQSTSAKPTLLANEVSSSKPALDFGSDYLQTAGTPIGATANLPYTKFVVFKYDSSTANNIMGGTSTAGPSMWGNTSSANLAVTHNGVSVISAASSVDTSRYYIGTVRYGAPVGVTNEINVDGVVKTTNSTNSTYTGTAIQLGAVAGTNFLDGKIAEAIAFNRALSDAEVAGVECYLSSHWGISVTGCSSYVNVAQPVAYKTFQRDGSNKADIPINGMASATPCTSIEASFNGGGYQTIDTSLVNGQYSGVLTNQNAGQGNLIVRCTDNTSISSTTNYVGIGDVFLVAGQSNATGQTTNMQSFSHPTLKAAVYDATAGWKIGNDDTDFDSPGKGSFWPLLATKIMSQTGYPAAFITTGIGSTCLVCSIDTWNKFGNAASYNSMLSDLTASGVNSVKAVLWHQGETDAQFSTSRVNMKAGLDALADNVGLDVPGSPKIVAANIGEVTAATATTVNNIRLAIQDAWNTNAKFVAGPSTYDLTTGDGVHFVGDTQAQTIADRWWASLYTAYYGGTEDGRGPRVTDVTTSSDKTRVIITFNDSELPLLPISSIGGITIKDAGVTKTQTSAVRITNTKVMVTLTSAATGAVTASVGAGYDGKGLFTNVTDNSTYKLPADMIVDQAATVASAGALPAVSYTGSFQEPVANTGAVNGSIVATLTDDTFANPLTLNTHVTVGNVPSGMTAVVTRNSSTQATFTLTGSASSHADANDVNNLTITWLDGAFTTATTASTVPGYLKNDGQINFRDVGGPGGVTTNLLMWLDAKVTTSLSNSSSCDNQATNGQEVACWKDQSDNGNNVTQTLTTNRPNLNTTDANGSAALDFSVDYLKTASTVSASNAAYTKFVVMKNTSGGNVFSSYVNGNAQTLGITGTNVTGYHNYSFINSGSSAIDTTGYHIVALRYGQPSAVTNVIKVDGVQKVSNSAATIYTGGPAEIGGLYSGVNVNYVGKVSEAVLYSGAMSDANITAVECYMATKWSIADINCAPTITSIVRQTPTSATTNSDTPTFRITFSGAVQNVDATDFSTNGTAAGASIASVSTVSSSIYDVQIAGLSSATGTVNLDVAGGNNIQSLGSVALSSTTPIGADETYTMDNAGPSAPGITSLGGDSSNPYYSTDTTPDFVGTGSEDGSTVTVKESSTTLCTSVVSGGNWSCTSSVLSEAAHSLNIYATDTAGNDGSATTPTLTIDSTAPATPGVPDLVAGSDTGTSSTDNLTSASTPSFTISCETGATVLLRESSTTLGSGTCSSSTVTIASSTLSETVHAVYSRQTDPAGNVSSDSSTLSVTIDLTAPATSGVPDLVAGSDSGSSSTDNITSATTPSFTISCVSGTTVNLRESSTTLGSGTCSSSTVTIASSTLSAGAHSVYSRQTDDAGNVSGDSSTLSVTVDTTAPGTPTITSLGGDSSNPYTSNDNTPDIVGGGEDGMTITVKESSTTLCTATVSSSVWTCTSSSLSDGAHTLDVSQSDPAGNTSGAASATLTISTAVPAAPGTPDMNAGTDTGSSSTDNLTSNATPSFTVSCVSGNTVDLRESSTTLGSGTCASSTVTIASSSLSAGAHTITARQTDSYANTSADSSGLSITIDVTASAAPGVPDMTSGTDTGSSSTDNLTSNPTPSFTISCVSGETVDLRESSTTLGTGTCASSTVTIASSSLSAGAHSIAARQTDPAGNVSSTSTGLSITIDVTAPGTPTITSMGGDSSAPYTTNDNTPDIAGGGEDGMTITVKESSTTLCIATVSSSLWTCTSSSLIDGAHSLDVTQSDPAGNTSGAASATLTISTAIPAAPGTPDMTAGTDTGSSSTDNLTNNPAPSFTVSCVSGNTVDLREGSTTLGSGTCASSTVTIASSSLSTGAHTIKARQTDAFANTSSDSSGLVITIDTTASAAPGTPDLTSGSDTGSSSTDNITSSTTPSFTISCVTGETVDLRESSTTLGSGTCSSSTVTIASSSLSAGAHSIAARQTDSAGNVSSTSSTLSITVDTTAPGTPTITSLGGDNTNPYTTNDSTPDFTGAGEDGMTVTVKESSTTLCSATVASSTWTCTSSSLADGAHILDATQSDPAGNTSSAASATLTISTALPAAPGTPDLTAGSDTGSNSTDNITNSTTPSFTVSCVSGNTVDLRESSTTLGSGTCSSSTVTIASSTLSAGAHSIAARQTDAFANTSSDSAGLSITIDVTASAAPGTPDLITGSDSGSSTTDNLTNDDTPTLTISCVSGETVDLRESSTTLASGTCSSSTVSLTSSSLGTGAHSLVARQTDTAGNVSSDSSALVVTIDTSAPAAPSITSLGGDSSDPYSTNDVTPDFVGGGVDGSTVLVKESSTTLCSTTVSSSTWTCTSSSLADGLHSLSITQVDPAGNSSSATTADLTVSTALPGAPTAPDMTAGTDSGSSSTDNITSDTTPDFTIGCISGQTVELLESSTMLASGTCASSTITLTSSTFSNGAHIVHARQIDAFLSVSADSPTLNITIDNLASLAPGVPDLTSGSDTGSSSTDNLTNDTTPDFTITCVSGETVDLREGSTTLSSGSCASSTITLTSSSLATGAHSVFARQTDSAGNVSASSSTLTVTIDTTAPSAPTITSLGGDSSDPYTTNDATPAFVGGGTDGSTVSVKEGITELCNASVSSSAWNCTSSSLTDGVHTLSITQTDAAGNTSSVTAATLTISTVLPATPGTPDLDAGSDTGSSSTDNITSDATPSFTLSCVSGNTVDLRESSTTLASGTCVSSTITLTSSTLSDGAHSITGRQTDSFANTSADSTGLLITIDTSAPAASGTPDLTTGSDTGSSSTDNTTSDTTPDFTISCVSGSAVDLREGTTTLGSGTCTSSTVTITSSILGAGSHSIYSRQSDAAGNTSADSSTLVVTIDATAPAAPGLTSLGGDTAAPYFSSDTTPTIVGTGGENGSVITVKDGSTTLCTATVSTGTWSCTSSTLAQAAYTLTIYATDTAGNDSTTVSPVLTIDTTAPGAPGVPDLIAASDTGSSNTDDLTGDATPSFTVSCDSGASVVIREGSTVLDTGTCASGTVILTSSTLSDGLHSITARQTDEAGNIGTSSSALAITINTTAPTAPPVLTPEAGTTTETTPLFTGTGTDGDLITVYSSTPGSTVLCTATVASGEWACVSTPLADGTYTFSITATNNLGNASPATTVGPYVLSTVGPSTPTPTPTSTTGRTLNSLAPSSDPEADTLETTPTPVVTDTDGDGSPDSQEISGPNKGDGNFDGIADKEQANVRSVYNNVIKNSITMEVGADCKLTELSVIEYATLNKKDNAQNYPVGLSAFTTKCAASDTNVPVKVFLDKVYDTKGWKLTKYFPASQRFADMSDLASYSSAGSYSTTKVSVMQYSVQDGSQYDLDGKADGSITDPAGPSVTTAAAATSTANTWWWWILIVLGALGIGGFAWSRRHHAES